MAERPRLDDSIVIRKGDARPMTGKRTPITVKLDEELYTKLVSYSGKFVPRKTHQAILVEALQKFLEEDE